MMAMCDQVAERIALGEPLGELDEHVATCESCQRLIALPAKLGATHHAIDPGLGFSSRMTVGAQHKIAARRRQRIAAGLAATVATAAIGAFIVTRTPDEPKNEQAITPTHPIKLDHENEKPTPAEDNDLTMLVRLADVDRSAHVSARWGHIKKPLAPYKKLLKGVTP
jgi:hypothetical protein